MKFLYILRHAKSSWASPGLGDFERPLNGRGEKQLVDLEAWFGAGLRQAGYTPPTQILCSPAKRTQQTLNGFVHTLETVTTEYPEKLYDGTMDHYLDSLSTCSADGVLMVAHNPNCDELVRYLSAPSSPAIDRLMERHFATANLAVLTFEIDEWSRLTQACGQLQAFLRPADMSH